MEICGPTLTYSILAVITIYYVYTKKRGMKTNINNVIFHAVWLMIVRFTCRMGYRGLAWGLVALPVLLLVALTLYVARMMLNMFRNLKPNTKGCGEKDGAEKAAAEKGPPEKAVAEKGPSLSRAKKVLSKIDKYFKDSKHI